MDTTLHVLIARVNAHFDACGLGLVDDEQVECLTDGDRADEALDMLDDWACRLGLNDDLFGDLCEWVENNRGVSDDRRSNGPRR